jgi:hypothetical protein
MREEGKMSWKIQIDGDKKYIDDLIEVFQTLSFEPFICKEGENIYLEWKMFDDITDAKEISSKAKTFLTLMPVVFHFKSERAIELLKVLKISYKDEKGEKVYDSEGNLESSIEISDDRKRKYILVADSAKFETSVKSVNLILTSKDGRIIIGLTTIESIKDYLKTNNDSESLKNLAEYLKPFLEILTNFSFKFSDKTPTKDIVEAEFKYGSDLELAKWTALRKIYGAIRDDLKIDFIENYLGKQLADDFYFTASNYHIHTKTEKENKNKKKKSNEPSRIMPLSEAEEFISTLLSKYIEEKARNNKP